MKRVLQSLWWEKEYGTFCAKLRHESAPVWVRHFVWDLNQNETQLQVIQRSGIAQYAASPYDRNHACNSRIEPEADILLTIVLAKTFATWLAELIKLVTVRDLTLVSNQNRSAKRGQELEICTRAASIFNI